MTRVRIRVATVWPEGETYRPVRRGMVWAPSAPFRSPDDALVLPESFPVVLDYSDTTIEVPPSDVPTWAWRVRWTVDSQSVDQFVHVPNTTDVLEFADLTRVDPATLTPTPAPIPAYRAIPLVLTPGMDVPPDTPNLTPIYRYIP